MPSVKIQEIVKYHSETDPAEPAFYTSTFMFVMNKDKYNALSAGQKKAVDEHCTSEWAEKVGSAWADFEIAGHAKLAAASNHDLVKLTPDQLDAWRKAVAPVVDQWGKDATKAGADPKAVLDGLKASLAKYKSAL